MFAFPKYCFREKLLRVHPQIFSYRLKNQHKRKRGTQKKEMHIRESQLIVLSIVRFEILVGFEVTILSLGSWEGWAKQDYGQSSPQAGMQEGRVSSL